MAYNENMEKYVLIIIPAYNEEDTIIATAQSVIAAGYDCIVINDGSTDRTLELCRMNDINVLNLSQNLGIGGAIQAGHKYALQAGYDIDIQFDGDGQHDVTSIPGLIEAIQNGADLAIGSRFAGGKNTFKSTKIRRLGISWLSFWIWLLTGGKVTDPTSGFRACNKKAIRLFAGNYSTDYPEPESIAVAFRKGLVIRDVPVVMHERQGGVSSIKPLSSIYYMIKVTLAIFITCITRKGIRRRHSEC